MLGTLPHALQKFFGFVGASLTGVTALFTAMGFLAERARLTMLGLQFVDHLHWHDADVVSHARDADVVVRQLTDRAGHVRAVALLVVRVPVAVDPVVAAHEARRVEWGAGQGSRITYRELKRAMLETGASSASVQWSRPAGPPTRRAG